ncbi:MAG: DNA methyltransferase [Candidatus Sumerlaeota bacterium]|nr:DNA methyltransferase [Candidatus Sumerlaeota bacterium]
MPDDLPYEKRVALHAICPYFAMFPEGFVKEQVEKHTRKNDWVFDPFCGRGTTILESLILGRNAAGSDINPVAFCISRAKAERPSIDEVIERISELELRYKQVGPCIWEEQRLDLPPFFRRAFYSTTLRELLFLRSSLDWRHDKIERFIAALIIGSLHGEMDRSKAYFSNQMPRTICLKPEYSLRYWKRHKLFPKKRRVFEMLCAKAEYRLNGLTTCSEGKVELMDARKSSDCFADLREKVSLVITSPPYIGVTRYEEDQWLRLWFLGGEPRPTYGRISKDDRHEKEDKYWTFLQESWAGIAPLVKKTAKMVIRIGAIGLDESGISTGLIDSVKSAFPHARLLTEPKRSTIIGRQSRSFIPSSKGCIFELDYVFTV